MSASRLSWCSTLLRRSALALLLLATLVTSVTAADGQWAVPTGFIDPEGKWTTEAQAYDDSTATYAADRSNRVGDGPWLELHFPGTVTTSLLQVYADFGYGIVDRFDIEVGVGGGWTPVYSGPIINDNACLIACAASGDRLRVRFHYLVTGYSFWVYDIRAYQEAVTPILPTVTTLAASSVTDTTAVLHARLTSDGGAPCAVRFRYRPMSGTDADVVTTPWETGQTSGDGTNVVLSAIDGLQTGVTYQFQAEAQNGSGVSQGELLTLTPSPIRPGEVGWVSAIGVTPSGTVETQWTGTVAAIDDDITTDARCYHPLGTAATSPIIEFTLPAISTDFVRVMAGRNNYISGLTIKAQAAGTTTWTQLPVSGFADRAWAYAPLPKRGVYSRLQITCSTTTTQVGTAFEIYEVQARVPPPQDIQVSFANTTPPAITDAGRYRLPLTISSSVSSVPVILSLAPGGSLLYGSAWTIVGATGSPPQITIPAGTVDPAVLIDVPLASHAGTDTIDLALWQAPGVSIQMPDAVSVPVQPWDDNICVFPPAPPTITPDGGSFSGPVAVSILAAGSANLITYTLDGSWPTVTSPAYNTPITLSKNTRLRAVAFYNGVYKGSPIVVPSFLAEATFAFLAQAADPVFQPGGGTYPAPLSVTVTSATPGAEIRYTTNGSDPVETSALVSGPIAIPTSLTLKARAYAPGFAPSSIAKAVYTINANPTIVGQPTAVGTGLIRRLAVLGGDDQGAAALRYTWAFVSGPATPVFATGNGTNAAQQLDALFPTPGRYQMRVVIADTAGKSVTAYLLVRILPVAGQTVTCTPPGGDYTDVPMVTVSADGPATVRYRTDGTAVTTTSPLVTAPIAIPQSLTLTAQAWVTVVFGGKSYACAGLPTSQIYTLTVPTPTISPAGGAYTEVVQATVGGAPSAELRFTLDGSEPTETSPLVTGPIAITQSQSLRVRGFRAGWTASAVASAAYALTVPTTGLAITPASGTVPAPALATVSVPTQTTVRYTLDGSDPVASSPAVTSQIVVDAGMELRVRAFRTGWTPSAVVHASYPIRVAPVVASLAAGTYVGAQTVTLSCPTAGATIRYSLDGSTPSLSYTGPIILPGSVTLTAIASLAGAVDSTPTIAIYTLAVPAPTLMPAAGSYQGPLTVTVQDADPAAIIHVTTDGSEPSTSSPILPPTGLILSATTTVRILASRSGWQDSAIGQAVYSIAVSTHTPIITWATPTDIPPGTALSAAQLNATTDVPGAFVYDPPLGTVLPTGAHTLTATFTPTDTVANTAATAAVLLRVLNPAASVLGITPASGSQVADGHIFTAVLRDELGQTTPAEGVVWSLDGMDGASIDATGVVRFPMYSVGTVTITATIGARIATSVVEVVPPAPVITAGGTYSYIFSASITHPWGFSGLIPLYTLDGSAPTRSSPMLAAGNNYDGVSPLTLPIDHGLTLTVCAYDPWNDVLGLPAQATYAFQLGRPTLSQAGGAYAAPLTIGLTSAAGSTTAYTLDGSEPTIASPAFPASGIRVERNLTIRMRSFRAGWLPSEIVAAAFVLVSPSPRFLSRSGEVPASFAVQAASLIPAAVLRYAIGTADPRTSGLPWPDGGLILPTGDQVVHLVSQVDGWDPSPAVTATFRVRPTVAPPVFLPAAGTYAAPTTVQVSCATDGAELRYTIDDREPDATDPLWPAGGLPLLTPGSISLRVRATAPGMVAQSASAGYQLVSPPDAGPPRLAWAHADVQVIVNEGVAHLDLRLDRPAPAGVHATLTYAGSAVVGVDVLSPPDAVDVPSGASSVTLDLVIPPNAATGGERTLVVSLVDAGTAGTYRLDIPATTNLHILPASAPPVLTAPQISPAQGSFAANLAVRASTTPVVAAIWYTLSSTGAQPPKPEPGQAGTRRYQDALSLPAGIWRMRAVNAWPKADGSWTVGPETSASWRVVADHDPRPSVTSISSHVSPASVALRLPAGVATHATLISEVGGRVIGTAPALITGDGQVYGNAILDPGMATMTAEGAVVAGATDDTTIRCVATDAAGQRMEVRATARWTATDIMESEPVVIRAGDMLLLRAGGPGYSFAPNAPPFILTTGVGTTQYTLASGVGVMAAYPQTGTYTATIRDLDGTVRFSRTIIAVSGSFTDPAGPLLAHTGLARPVALHLSPEAAGRVTCEVTNGSANLPNGSGDLTAQVTVDPFAAVDPAYGPWKQTYPVAILRTVPERLIVAARAITAFQLVAEPVAVQETRRYGGENHTYDRDTRAWSFLTYNGSHLEGSAHWRLDLVPALDLSLFSTAVEVLPAVDSKPRTEVPLRTTIVDDKAPPADKPNAAMVAQTAAFVQAFTPEWNKPLDLKPREIILRQRGRNGIIDLFRPLTAPIVQQLQLQGNGQSDFAAYTPTGWARTSHEKVTGWVMIHDESWEILDEMPIMDWVPTLAGWVWYPGAGPMEWQWGNPPAELINVISVTPQGLDDPELIKRTNWNPPFEKFAWNQQTQVGSSATLMYQAVPSGETLKSLYSYSSGSTIGDNWYCSAEFDVKHNSTTVSVTVKNPAGLTFLHSPLMNGYYYNETGYGYFYDRGGEYSVTTQNNPFLPQVGVGSYLVMQGDCGQSAISTEQADTQTVTATLPGDYTIAAYAGNRAGFAGPRFDWHSSSDTPQGGRFVWFFNWSIWNYGGLLDGSWWEEDGSAAWWSFTDDYHAYATGRVIIPGTLPVAAGLGMSSNAYGESFAATYPFTAKQSHNRVEASSNAGVIPWSTGGTYDFQVDSSDAVTYAFHRDDEVTTAITGDYRNKPIETTTRHLTSGIGIPPSSSAPLIALPGNLSVSAASGNVVLQIPVVQGTGDAPELVLTYNSQEGFDHGYGPGWRTNWDMRRVDNLLIDETGARVPLSGPRLGPAYAGAGSLRGDGRELAFDDDGYLSRVTFIGIGRTWTVNRNSDHQVTSVVDSRDPAHPLVCYPFPVDTQRQTGMASLTIPRSGAWSAQPSGAGGGSDNFAAWAFTYHGSDRNYALATVTCTGSSAAAASTAPMPVPTWSAHLSYETIPTPTGDGSTTDTPPTQSGMKDYVRCSRVRYIGHETSATYAIAYESITVTTANQDQVFPASWHTRTSLTDPQGAVTRWRLRSADAWDSVTNATGVERRQRLEKADRTALSIQTDSLRGNVLRSWTETPAGRLDEVAVAYTTDGHPSRITRAPGTPAESVTSLTWNTQAGLPAGVSVLNRTIAHNVIGIDGCGPIDLERGMDVGTGSTDTGLPVSVRGSDSLETRMSYTGQGKLDAVIDTRRQAWDLTTTAAGLIQLPTSPAGRHTVTTPDADHPSLPGSVTLPTGETVTTRYDVFGQPASQGRTGLKDSSVIRGPFGQILRSVAPDGTTQTWVYDALLRPKTVTTTPAAADQSLVPGASATVPTLPVESWAYDATADHGLLITHTRGTTTVETTTLDAGGRMVAHAVLVSGGTTGAAQMATTRQSWQPGLDRLQQITDPAGVVHTPTYDDLGRITAWTSIGQSLERTTAQTFNALGWLLSSTDANGLTTRWSYNTNGQVVRTINPLGGWQWTGRDERGAVTMQRASAGAPTVIDRDADGDVRETTDRDGVKTVRTWKTVNGKLVVTVTRTAGGRSVTTTETTDHAERSTTMAMVDGSTTRPLGRVERGEDGQIRTQTAPGLPQVALSFAAGQPWQTRTTTRLPDGSASGSELIQTSTQTLTADGRPDTATDAWGNTGTATPDLFTGMVDTTVAVVAGATRTQRVLTRDAAGRPLTTETRLATPGQPEQVLTETVGYDAFGRVASRLGTDGVMETYGYDLGDRLTSRTRPGQGTTTFVYDELGNVIRSTDGANRTVEYAFDALGRKINERHGADVTILDYDAATMRLRRLIEPGNRITTYVPDARGNIAEIRKPGDQVIIQHWDDLGRRTGVDFPGGMSETWTYVGDTQLVDTHTDRHGRTWTHRYTDTGSLASMSTGGTTLTFTARPISGTGAVLEQTVTETTAQGTRTETIRLDAAGRVVLRSTPDVADIAYGYDAAGRLTERGDLSYRYDSAGRLETVLLDGAERLRQTYAPDTGLLATQTLPNNVTRTLGYDAAGQPNALTLSGSVTGSWSATRDIAGRLATVTDPLGAVSYLYQDGRLTQAERTGTGAYRMAWQTDARGNRTRRTVYLAPQSIALDFTSQTLPSQILVESGPWQAGGQLASSSAARAAVQLGAGVLPHLRLRWSGEASLILTDAAGTWIRVVRDTDDAGKARIQVRSAQDVSLCATSWSPAAELAAIELAIADDGGLTLRSTGGAELATPTSLSGLAGLTLISGSAGATFDDLRWENGAGKSVTVTDVDAADRPLTLTETLTDAGGTLQSTRTTTNRYNPGGTLKSRTDTVNGVETTTVTATWDDLDRLLSWATPTGSTAFAYRPGVNVPLSDTLTMGTQDPVTRLYQADASGILAIGPTRFGVVGRSAFCEITNGQVSTLITDLSGSVAGRVGMVTGSTSSIIGWQQQTIYQPDGVATSRTGYLDEFGRQQFGGLGAMAGGVGYRGMYMNPQMGLYRTDHRLFDPAQTAFVSSDPVWAATGQSGYAWTGGDFVNSADPSGLDWQYMDGNWVYQFGTRKDVPRPPSGFTPANNAGSDVFTMDHLDNLIQWNDGMEGIAGQAGEQAMLLGVMQRGQGYRRAQLGYFNERLAILDQSLAVAGGQLAEAMAREAAARANRSHLVERWYDHIEDGIYTDAYLSAGIQFAHDANLPVRMLETVGDAVAPYQRELDMWAAYEMSNPHPWVRGAGVGTYVMARGSQTMGWLARSTRFVARPLAWDAVFTGGASRAGGIFVRPGQRTFTVRRSPKLAADESFDTYEDFLARFGPARESYYRDFTWEHIVEQSQAGRLGARNIYNTQNTIPIPWYINKAKADFYSTTMPGSKITWREWLSTQTYEQQYKFGIETLRRLGVTIAP